MIAFATATVCCEMCESAFLSVFAGPQYDSFTDSGYIDPGSSRPAPALINVYGVAVGMASKVASGVNQGPRGISWDGSGRDAVELVNFGTDDGGFAQSSANAINDQNVIAGSADRYNGSTSLGSRAVRWHGAGATPIELEHLGTSTNGFTVARALAINESSTTVGQAFKFDSGSFRGTRAVRWEGNGTTITELGGLGQTVVGASESSATDVNAPGTVAGFAVKYESGVPRGSRAVRWESGSTLAIELGHLGTDPGGNTNSEALAINDSGTTIGYAATSSFGNGCVGRACISLGDRAVRWNATVTGATALGHLGTDAQGRTSSRAYAINSSDTAAGFAEKYVGGISKGSRAVRWDGSSSVAHELEVLSVDPLGNSSATALAINESGHVVGEAALYDENGVLHGVRAVYWNPAGEIVELDSLIDLGSAWRSLDAALGISDTGWITGVGTFDDGSGNAYRRWFSLNIHETIVPEPGAALLAWIGLVALMGHSRRQPGR